MAAPQVRRRQLRVMGQLCDARCWDFFLVLAGDAACIETSRSEGDVEICSAGRQGALHIELGTGENKMGLAGQWLLFHLLAFCGWRETLNVDVTRIPSMA